MEYEQLENGIKIINRSISGQDLSGYYDLLAPEVVLVCHFPFPEHVGPGMVESSETTAILRRKMKPERRKHELLVAKEQDIEAMHARYQRYLIQQREKTKRKSTSAVVEEGGAAPGGEEEANPTPGAGAENTAQPSNSATAAHTPTLPDDAVPMERRVSTAIAMRTKKQQRATKQQQQQQEQGSAPRSASVSKSVKATPQSCGAKGVALYLQSEAESIPQYSDRVQISEGRELVSEQFCFILSWMNQEKYIGDIIVQLEPRKGILQDNEVLPPPQRPKNEMDLCNLLGRQYTDRNQRLSRLTFFWGKEDLLFCDQCYFDDGFIVTVHRRMLGVDMMLERTPATQKHLSPSQRTDRVRAEISNFYGATQSRVNATSHTWPLLDYSFFDIADAYDLPKIRPLKGKVHNARTVRPAMDPRLVQGVFLNQQNDPVKSSANTRTLIKAKNKKGDEEAYEFELGNRQRASFFEHDDGAGKTGGLDGVAAPASKYDATCVRISSCGLCEHTEKLVPILRSLVANAYMNLHSLDLSDNRIEHLPDFSQLPLQKLLLHGNRISAWDEVEQNVCPLPYLFSLTLHGNPISDNNSQYWQFALSRILRHPNRLVKLKQLDFVTLSAQDYEVAASHDMFTTGNTAVFKVATTMIRTK